MVRTNDTIEDEQTEWGKKVSEFADTIYTFTNQLNLSVEEQDKLVDSITDILREQEEKYKNNDK